MYILLVGYPPFGGATERAILRQVRKGQYTFTGPNWDAISDDAKHCIKQMLVMKPSRRATAAELLDEKWFKHASAVSDNVIHFLQCVCSLRHVPACKCTSEKPGLSRVGSKGEHPPLEVEQGSLEAAVSLHLCTWYEAARPVTLHMLHWCLVGHVYTYGRI